MSEQQQPQTFEASSPLIGLIGGLGVGATTFFYRVLVDRCQAAGFCPRLLIAHADVNRVLAFARAGNRAGLAKYLAGFVDELASAGASFAAIPAITPHLAIDELMERSPIRFANVLKLTASEIQSRGIKRVAVFGTKFTIETAFFGALEGVDVVRPRTDEVTEIHATYVTVVQTGVGTQAHAIKLREIAQMLIHRDGVEAVVLAGTELALVFNSSNTDFPVVDCCEVLVDFLVKAARPPKLVSLKSP